MKHNYSLTFPLPKNFVGVFTEMKIKSDSRMAVLTSVEKKRFFPLQLFTTSSKPGCNKSKMGQL